MNPAVAIWVGAFCGAIAFVVLPGLWVLALCVEAKRAETKAAWEAERAVQERLAAERDEREALAVALDLLPDPLEAMYAAPAREPERTLR